MNSKKSITVNTILNTIRMTLTIFVPLITYPYIVHIFGAEGIGQYEWVKSVVNILTLVASLGVSTYAIREGAKIRDDRALISKFAQELFVINMIATIICYFILGILIASIPKFGMYKVYLLIYGVNIGLSALSFDWVYGVYEDYLYITARQIIVQILSVCGLFLFVREQNDLIKYVIITTISNSGANIFNFIRARKYIDFKLLKRYELKKHVGPVTIFFGTGFAMDSYNSLNTLILGLIFSDRVVGYYNVAVKINTILATFFSAMSPVYLPRMTKYATSNDLEHETILLKKIIGLKTILIYPMIAGLFCFAPQIIWLIAGTGFENAVITLRILCFVLGFIILSSNVQRDIMIPNGQERTVLNLTLAAAVLNICISLLLISRIGYNGAALGSLIAEGIIFFLGTLLIKKIGIHLISMIIRCSYKYIIAVAVMISVDSIITRALSSNGSIILIGLPISAAVYFSTILLIKDDFMINEMRNIFYRLRNIIRKEGR